jgi:hypothetical protein
MMHRPFLRPAVIAIIAMTFVMTLTLSATSGRADPVEGLVEFSAGTTARADEVNANFSELADSVNDNDTRVTDLEAEVVDLQGALEAAISCPTLDPSDEMIKVGGVCIDKYEASIWDAPTGGNQIIGTLATDYCSLNGQDCDNIYARSVANVEPARFINWFQAQAALANSGKRLPTNAEWQMAVRGTPDDGTCNVDSVYGMPANTGGAANCVSRFDIHDMVGNLWEWVADWVPRSIGCSGNRWPAGFGDDFQGICGAATDDSPGALLRGGNWGYQTAAGPFAVIGGAQPSSWGADFGFRGAR